MQERGGVLDDAKLFRQHRGRYRSHHAVGASQRIVEKEVPEEDTRYPFTDLVNKRYGTLCYFDRFYLRQRRGLGSKIVCCSCQSMWNSPRPLDGRMTKPDAPAL